MPKQSSFLSLPYAQVVARLDPENSNRIPVDKLLHSFEDDFEHDRLATTTNPPYRAVRKCMTPLGTSTKRAGQVRVMPGNKQTANQIGVIKKAHYTTIATLMKDGLLCGGANYPFAFMQARLSRVVYKLCVSVCVCVAWPGCKSNKVPSVSSKRLWEGFAR
jgi:hypothetical protein